MDEVLFPFMQQKAWAFILRILEKYACYNRHGYWTDGEEILCKTEEAAEHLADFLEDLGFDYVRIGYYDPEEDQRNNEVNNHTGWYYVSVD